MSPGVDGRRWGVELRPGPAGRRAGAQWARWTQAEARLQQDMNGWVPTGGHKALGRTPHHPKNLTAPTNLVRQLLRRRQVPAKRLLNDHPQPRIRVRRGGGRGCAGRAAGRAGACGCAAAAPVPARAVRAHAPQDLRVHGRRQGEVKQPSPWAGRVRSGLPGVQSRAECDPALGRVVAAPHVAHPTQKSVHRRRGAAGCRQVGAQVIPNAGVRVSKGRFRVGLARRAAPRGGSAPVPPPPLASLAEPHSERA